MSKQLTLPTIYEDIKRILDSSGESYIEKLMDFVKPVESAEGELAEVAMQMGQGSGRVVFLLGESGSGKSTFIESLTWRRHLPFSRLEEVDCASMGKDTMNELLDRLKHISRKKSLKGKGDEFTAVVINYLENLENIDREEIKYFFRPLNGILRKSPLFIIWPVTDRSEAEDIIESAKGISNTMFHKGKEIVEFEGPEKRSYEEIAKNTISVLNNGLTIEDFNMTNADLEECKERIGRDGRFEENIRGYLRSVKSKWRERNNIVEKMRSKIPSPTEVWIVISYKEAEDMASRFARRGDNVDSAWKAFHDKMWEYVDNSRRKADWTPKRLQLAIGGTLTTRIMHLTTNSFVSSVAAFMSDSHLNLKDDIDQSTWFRPSAAAEYISNTPVVRQLKQEPSPPGKKKGGPSKRARERAEPVYEKIVDWVSGSGNDRHVNRAVAKAIERSLTDDYTVAAEEPHPWIPNITPDITVGTPYGKRICIEMYYTTRYQPNVIAGYTLDKLHSYMKQIERYVDSEGEQTEMGI